MKLLEYLPYFVATILFGWYSPRIFTSDRWPARHQWLFTAALTIMMFAFAGIYRLGTGEDITEKIQDDIFCPLFSLSHCPGSKTEENTKTVNLPPATQPSSSMTEGGASTTSPPSTGQSTGPTDTELDLIYWESIRNSQTAGPYAAYLNKFPNGQFAGLARERLSELSAAQMQRNRVAVHEGNATSNPGSTTPARTNLQGGDATPATNPPVAADTAPSQQKNVCVQFNGKTICDTQQNNENSQP